MIMATVVVHLWVTPESAGLKAGALVRPGVSSQVEGGARRVTGGRRDGAKVWTSGPRPRKTGCAAAGVCPTLPIVMQQLLFL